MTPLDDTRHCPMCEDAAKKILELEHRVKVLTDAMLRVIDSNDVTEYGAALSYARQVINATPQQTAAQIERGHIEWMMKLEPAQWFIDVTTNDISTGRYEVAAEEYRHMAVPLYKIPPLPKESKE